jgi:hypothetical protein
LLAIVRIAFAPQRLLKQFFYGSLVRPGLAARAATPLLCAAGVWLTPAGAAAGDAVERPPTQDTDDDGARRNAAPDERGVGDGQSAASVATPNEADASAATPSEADAFAPVIERPRKKNARHGRVRTPAGTIELVGRVYARADLARERQAVVTPRGTVEERDVTGLDLRLASARLALEYQSPHRWLEGALEAEFAGKPRLKDAYVEAHSRGFRARAGQFKMPASVLDTQSSWTLPLVRRGLLHELLSDWLDVGGRRPGMMVGWRGRGGLHPTLTLGVFQGRVLNDIAPGERDTDFVRGRSLDAQSWIARASVRISALKLGAWYEHRVGSPDVGAFGHYLTGGAHALLDLRFSSGGLRVWADALGGTSWYEHALKRKDQEDATFFAARLLTAVRHGGTKVSAFYVEPYGFMGVLDPDADVANDAFAEIALGLNVGLWQELRVTAQAELTRAQRNFPMGSSGFLGGANAERKALTLQIGMLF